MTKPRGHTEIRLSLPKEINKILRIEAIQREMSYAALLREVLISYAREIQGVSFDELAVTIGEAQAEMDAPDA